jgi:hypothetical protein
VATEFSSALSIKLRTGQLRIADRAGALATFTRLVTDSFTAIPVSRLDFRTAPRLANQHAIGLRAGDALNLAICANHSATLRTLDRRLGDAGLALETKFRDCARNAVQPLSDAGVERLLAAIGRLETRPDARELMTAVAG